MKITDESNYYAPARLPDGGDHHRHHRQPVGPVRSSVTLETAAKPTPR
jgi:hypothetical protein